MLIYILVPSLFVLVLHFLFIMKEDKAEDEHAEHHAECAGVVRVGLVDEAVVLRVLERAHRHLQAAVEVRPADASVVHAVLEHSVHIGQHEARRKPFAFVFHCVTNKWIDAEEFQLHIVGIVWNPASVAQFVDLNGVFNLVLDGIAERCG